MNQELFQLCYLQLESIMEETGKAIDIATQAAGDCMEGVSALEANGKVDDISLQKIRKGMANIVTRLQFHDEFSQRIAHLLAILRMVEEVINAENVNLTEKKEIIDKICSIFSIRSEFEQLEKVFPHLGRPDITDSVELF